MSGIPLDPVYGPDDAVAAGAAATTDPEWPGVYPYTRGPYASMYRSKLWTMRMFAGFGTAEDTNVRFRDLLRAGGDGLSVAYDLPTLMGRDSDDPLSEGEVGRCGVAVDTLADAEDLFAGIDLAATTTSMTINSPASMCFAMYLVAAERAGAQRAQPRRHPPERHLEGVPGPEGVPLPAASLAAAGHRRDPVLCGRDAAVPPGVGLRLPHPRSRFDRRTRARLHPGQRVRLRGGRARAPASTSTSSHRASPSSSTHTSTSSRRSPSTGPRAGSGHGG